MEARTPPSLGRRMLGAAFLDVDTYEEVEADTRATGQAAAVVAMAAAAHAVGVSGQGVAGIVGGVLSTLVGWGVWAGATYLIGDKVFGGTATWGELLRTLGFAHAPSLLLVLAIVPFLGWGVEALVGLWMLVAGFVAIRQALDVGNWKTFFTVLVGWGAVAFLYAILGVVA